MPEQSGIKNFELLKKIKKMLQTVNIKNLREELLYEVNHSNPEMLQLFYNFIQVVKMPGVKEKKRTLPFKTFWSNRSTKRTGNDRLYKPRI